MLASAKFGLAQNQQKIYAKTRKVNSIIDGLVTLPNLATIYLPNFSFAHQPQSWAKDPFLICRGTLTSICSEHAISRGKAIVADVFDVIKQIRKTDLVIIDPPYSGVQYSRFYHVLETLARGDVGPVFGRGRYPEIGDRPQSPFSNASGSTDALERLLSGLAKKRATVIFTFPKGRCSNGLSGSIVKKTSVKYFNIKEELVHGQFSTLGGNNHKDNRRSRKISRELLLLLQPKGK